MSNGRTDEDWMAAVQPAAPLPPVWDVLLKHVSPHPFIRLIETDPSISRAVKSRLLRFCAYQEQVGQQWFDPQLNMYRDFLLGVEKKPISTVATYISTLRSAYRQLARAEWLHQLLYSVLPDSYPDAQKLRYIERFCQGLEWQVSVWETEVAHPPYDLYQDLLRDSLFLTPAEINQLLSAPATDTLKGVRDRAIMATLLCTGIWAHELVRLDAEDILEDALQVREEDTVNRVVPFGDLRWGLELLRVWLRQAGIFSGAAFVSIGRNDRIKVDEPDKPRRLSAVAVSLMLRQYPIRVDDQYITVRTRHLRYMYGYILYSQGVPEYTILQNMGYGKNQGARTLWRIGVLPRQADLRKMDAQQEE